LINEFADQFDAFLDFLLVRTNKSLQMFLKFFTERQLFVTAELGVS
jgi:hypothetical protein